MLHIAYFPNDGRSEKEWEETVIRCQKMDIEYQEYHSKKKIVNYLEWLNGEQGYENLYVINGDGNIESVLSYHLERKRLEFESNLLGEQIDLVKSRWTIKDKIKMFLKRIF